MHAAQRRLLSGLHSAGECEQPACTVARKSAGGAVHLDPRAAGRRHHDGLPGSEAVLPAPIRQRHPPQWQLDLGTLHGRHHRPRWFRRW